MKKVFIFICLFASITLVNAQLFKKLKDKAANALDKKPEEKKPADADNNTNAGSNADNAANKTAKVPAAPPANGSLSFTLDDGERFMYDEAKIYVLKGTQLGWQFVTQKGKEFYLIDNGNRTGPFSVPSIESANSSSNLNDDGDGEKVAKEYTKTVNGKLMLVFNGKSYGPFFMISEMQVSADKKHFFALVIEGASLTAMSDGSSLISDIGTSPLKLNGIGTKLMVSHNFKHAIAAVMDTKGKGEVYMVTSEGKKTGPVDMMSAMGSNGETWLSDDGTVYSIPSQSPRELVVNGNGVAKFAVDISRSRLAIAPDPAKSVFYDEGTLYRGDGTKEVDKNVVFPHIAAINGALYLCWFQVYKNPETNKKDVYVCKKPL